jgi:PAS domain S-box-containing protein
VLDKKWRILIVDDSRDDRLEAKAALLRDFSRRYVFTEAETGEEGLRKLGHDPESWPTCLLLDYSLPDMDGVDFLRAMPQREGQVAVPVVVLTGYATAETSCAVLKAGAQDFVGKDWLTPSSLSRAVDSAIERHVMACELWQKQRRIDEQREWLEVVLRGIADGVIATDISGHVRFLNAAAEQLTGFTMQEAVGQPLSSIFRLEHGNDSDLVPDAIARVLREGRLLGLGNHTMLVRRDGRRLAIDDSGAPLRDDKGETVGLVFIFRDITEKRQAEQALLERQALLDTILQNTPALICVIDLEGRYVHVNRRFEELVQRSAAEIIGRRPRDLFPPELAAGYEENHQRVIREGRACEFEETIWHADGPHTYAAVKAPFADALGYTAGIIEVATDISERKRVEDLLRETDRRKNEFLAMLAHELRNPLVPIRNAVHLLSQFGPTEPMQNRLLEMISRQVSHLVHLVDDLLDVSRITRGIIHLKQEEVTMSDVITAALESSGPLIQNRRHELTVIMPKEPLRVRGDVTRLSQVVLNLLNNSAKYTPAGGHIRLSLAAESGYAVVRVLDDGVGIPRDLLPRVFDLFVQAERSLDRAEGGLGLGLTLVRNLVKMHGGSVDAHSDGPGRGSEFIVRLPLIAERDASDPAQSLAARCSQLQTDHRRGA